MRLEYGNTQKSGLKAALFSQLMPTSIYWFIKVSVTYCFSELLLVSRWEFGLESIRWVDVWEVIKNSVFNQLNLYVYLVVFFSSIASTFSYNCSIILINHSWSEGTYRKTSAEYPRNSVLTEMARMFFSYYLFSEILVIVLIFFLCTYHKITVAFVIDQIQ